LVDDLRGVSRTVFGNAYRDRNDRQWLIGSFINPSSPRSCAEVEVKWGSHAKGDARTLWSKSEEATSLAILISGRMVFFFGEQTECVLSESGDYVLWPPNQIHAWQATKDSTVITIRWPISRERAHGV
jgi:hypothetical protein